MLEIVRSSGFNGIAIGRKSYEHIQEAIKQIADTYFGYIQECGELQGPNYSIVVSSGRELPGVLQEHFNSPERKYFVETIRNDAFEKTLITAWDVEDHYGAQVQIYDDPEDQDEFYELDERQYQGAGSSWIKVLFDPEEAKNHPELAPIASLVRAEILNPDTLGLVVGSEVGSSDIIAEAKLDRFTIAHFSGLLALYENIAYEGWEPQDRVGSSREFYFEQLKSGEAVGLRSATKYVRSAKHLFGPDIENNTIDTCLYLNYCVDIGPMRLLFKDDLAMANEYRWRAAAFMIAEGIATDATEQVVLSIPEGLH